MSQTPDAPPPPPASALRGLTLCCPQCQGVEMVSAELQGILSFIATGGHGLAERLEHEAQESLSRRRERVDEMDRQSRGHGPAGLDLSDLV